MSARGLFAPFFLFVLACGSASKSDPVKGVPDTRCEIDADCELVGLELDGEDRCCMACGYTAATKPWAQAFDASCDGVERGECPMYKCDQPENPRAVCERGSCRVRSDASDDAPAALLREDPRTQAPIPVDPEPDVEPSNPEIPRGAAVRTFAELEAGGEIGFETLKLEPFPEVEMEEWFGKQQADDSAFFDAFNARLKKALGTSYEEVQLFNGGSERTSLAFVYFEDRSIRAIELPADPKLTSWLEAISNDMEGTTEHTVREDGMSGSTFTDWSTLLAEPGTIAVERAPQSFKKEVYDAEKSAYFDFQPPGPDDLLYSKARFEAAWAGFSKARALTASKPDPAALEALQKRVGVPLPGDVRALYEATGGIEKAFFDFDLLSVEDVASEYAIWQRIFDEWTLDDLQSHQRAEAGIYPVYISPRWIPFIDLVGGNYLAIDLGPMPGGTYGQVIVAGADVDGKRRIAAGLTEFLEKAATYDGSKEHELYSVFGELRL